MVRFVMRCVTPPVRTKVKLFLHLVFIAGYLDPEDEKLLEEDVAAPQDSKR